MFDYFEQSLHVQGRNKTEMAIKKAIRDYVSEELVKPLFLTLDGKIKSIVQALNDKNRIELAMEILPHIISSVKQVEKVGPQEVIIENYPSFMQEVAEYADYVIPKYYRTHKDEYLTGNYQRACASSLVDGLVYRVNVNVKSPSISPQLKATEKQQKIVENLIKINKIKLIKKSTELTKEEAGVIIAVLHHNVIGEETNTFYQSLINPS